MSAGRSGPISVLDGGFRRAVACPHKPGGICRSSAAGRAPANDCRCHGATAIFIAASAVLLAALNADPKQSSLVLRPGHPRDIAGRRAGCNPRSRDRLANLVEPALRISGRELSQIRTPASCAFVRGPSYHALDFGEDTIELGPDDTIIWFRQRSPPRCPASDAG